MAPAVVNCLRDEAHEADTSPSIHQIYVPLHLEETQIQNNSKRPSFCSFWCSHPSSDEGIDNTIGKKSTDQFMAQLDSSKTITIFLARATSAEDTHPPEPGSGWWSLRHDNLCFTFHQTGYLIAVALLSSFASDFLHILVLFNEIIKGCEKGHSAGGDRPVGAWDAEN